MNSGKVIDKASMFDIFYGDLKTAPLISETPINLECKLVDVIDLESNSEIFIGEIVQSWAEKKFLRRGYPRLKKLDPILFSISSNSYYSIGRRIGRAWHRGLSIPASKVRRKKFLTP
jgi:flavin reductase (DIM6/NTAB) family NADH-FMN oxidoreductase RutF